MARWPLSEQWPTPVGRSKPTMYIRSMQQEQPFDRAIRMAGGLAALARALGESTQTLWNWRARGEPPANRCAAIESITGVSRQDLRHDWMDYWPEAGDQ